jgi:hypothetical protein
MAKGIDKPTLAMFSPRHLVVANPVDAAMSSGGYGPFNKTVRILDEDFDAHRSTAQ